MMNFTSRLRLLRFVQSANIILAPKAAGKFEIFPYLKQLIITGDTVLFKTNPASYCTFYMHVSYNEELFGSLGSIICRITNMDLGKSTSV